MKMPQGTWSGPCALWRAAPAWQYLGRSSLRLTQGGCAQDALVVRNNDTEVVRLWWPFISKWMGIYTWIYIYLYTLEYIHTYIYTWVNILYTHEYTHTERLEYMYLKDWMHHLLMPTFSDTWPCWPSRQAGDHGHSDDREAERAV